MTWGYPQVLSYVEQFVHGVIYCIRLSNLSLFWPNLLHTQFSGMWDYFNELGLLCSGAVFNSNISNGWKSLSADILTHWGWDKMRSSFSRQHFQMDFLEWKLFELKFYCSLFLGSPINNIPALFQIMAWRRSGNKPLSESMMVSLLMLICSTQPQWVKRNTWSAMILQNLAIH